jgi:hypothetical protein
MLQFTGTQLFRLRKIASSTRGDESLIRLRYLVYVRLDF